MTAFKYVFPSTLTLNVCTEGDSYIYFFIVSLRSLTIVEASGDTTKLMHETMSLTVHTRGMLEVLTRSRRSRSLRVSFLLRNDVRLPLTIHGATKVSDGPKSRVVPMNFKILECCNLFQIPSSLRST
jgi:hypothetical protein